MMKSDNFIDLLKESLIDFKDIERNHILKSDFTFMLINGSVENLLKNNAHYIWMNNKEQRKFFVKQL